MRRIGVYRQHRGKSYESSNGNTRSGRPVRSNLRRGRQSPISSGVLISADLTGFGQRNDKHVSIPIQESLADANTGDYAHGEIYYRILRIVSFSTFCPFFAYIHLTFSVFFCSSIQLQRIAMFVVWLRGSG